jgi:hypothetical protein
VDRLKEQSWCIKRIMLLLTKKVISMLGYRANLNTRMAIGAASTTRALH